MELVWEDGQLLVRGPSGSTTQWTPFSSVGSLAHAESTKCQKATPFPSLNQEESCHLALIGKLPTWNMEEEKELKNTSNKMDLMNFAHCSRPADLQRAHNLGTSATKPSTIRDFSCTETVKDKYEVSVPHNSTLVKSTLLNSIHGPESIVSPKSQTRLPAAQEDLRSAAASWIQNSPFSDHQHKTATQIGASVDNKFHNQPPPKFSSPSAIAFKGKPRTERYVEPLGACSSVSSRGASNNPNYITTRNHQLNESEYENDDDEQVKYVKKTSGDRKCRTAKRYRDAEVHNLSEKRRRLMIDKKTRVLQKLIPNCTKVDTISVLDKAIEYLKTLQLELQIMSMANKVHMATMLHPTTHYLHAPLANCSALGQFPNSPFVIGASVLTSVDGSRLQMLRHLGQVPLMSVSHSPSVSLPRGPASFMGFMASHHPSTVELSAANMNERENHNGDIQCS